MIKLSDTISMADINILSLIMNMQAQQEISSFISEIASQDELRTTCISMFNKLAEVLAEDGNPEFVVLLNFLGLALETNMNVVEMQKRSFARVLEFKAELKRRVEDAKTQANRPAAE